MEQEGDHRARIFSGSEPTDQPLVHRTEFCRRTGDCFSGAAYREGPGGGGGGAPAGGAGMLDGALAVAVHRNTSA